MNNCCQIPGHLRNRRLYSQRDHLNWTFQGFILVLKAKYIFICSSHCDGEWKKSRKRPFKLIIYLWWLKHYRKMHVCFFFLNHIKTFTDGPLRSSLKCMGGCLLWERLCSYSVVAVGGCSGHCPLQTWNWLDLAIIERRWAACGAFFQCCDLRVLFQVTHHMRARSVCGSFPLLENSSS